MCYPLNKTEKQGDVRLAGYKVVFRSKVRLDETILLGPPGCAQVFPLLEPGPPRFFWWYENSE